MATAAPAGHRRWHQSAAGLDWWEGAWHVWQPARREGGSITNFNIFTCFLCEFN